MSVFLPKHLNLCYQEDYKIEFKFCGTNSLNDAIAYYKKEHKKGNVFCSFNLAWIWKFNKKYSSYKNRAELIFAEIFRKIEDKANNGDVYAQELMCIYYYEGIYVQHSYEEVIKWALKIGEKGSGNSQTFLGLAYRWGFGNLACSKEDAQKWFELTYKKGFVLGIFHLVNFYLYEDLDVEYKKKAFNILNELKNKGINEALEEIGHCYERGYGIEINEKKALEHYKLAVENGVLSSYLKIAELYKYKMECEDSEKIFKDYYFLAAEKNVDEAIYEIAFWYKEGRNVEQSHELAVQWFEKLLKVSEDKDYQVTALEEIARHYLIGLGVKKSLKKALKYYYKLNEVQIGVKKHSRTYYFDFAVSNKPLKKDNGNISCEKMLNEVEMIKGVFENNAESQYELGMFYGSDDIFYQSYKDKVYWLKKSANQGYYKAQYRLAECYEKGEGVKRSIKKALELYKLAEVQNCWEAKYKVEFLTKYYKRFKKVKVGEEDEKFGSSSNNTYDELIELIDKALVRNYKNSQYELGCKFLEGKCVKRNMEQAKYWIEKSANQGNELAQMYLNSIK